MEGIVSELGFAKHLCLHQRNTPDINGLMMAERNDIAEHAMDTSTNSIGGRPSNSVRLDRRYRRWISTDKSNSNAGRAKSRSKSMTMERNTANVCS